MAKIYSSYELGLLGTDLPRIGNQQNLDLVNWIINQNFTANPQYNYGEVQAAIWTLLGDSYNPNGSDLTAQGPVILDDVNAIVTAAQANGENFVPDTNQFIAVVFDPGNNQQPFIGQIKAAALGDFVWNDLNANGIQDFGEPGIAEAIVNLVRDINGDGDFLDDNELLQTTKTDSTGFYKFKGLTPSLEYQVQFSLPTGFNTVSPRQVTGSTPANDSDGLLSNKVYLSPGEYNQTIDSGFYKLASLGDRVWEDSNGDGLQNDGATGISGQTVTLIGGGTDGVIGTGGDDTTATTTTGTDGFYQFTGLTPGVQYQVMFNKPDGTVFTTQDANSNSQDADDSDADPNTGKSQIVTLSSGENNPTIDAGVYTPASIGDRVWEDSNGNGQQDGTEPGIVGAKVELYTCVNNAPGSLVATTTTGANGIYNFTGLKPGEYIVKFITPDGGYTQTTANVGTDDNKDSDAGAGGLTGCYTLKSGDNNTTVDAGFSKSASLGDRVWVDSNGDGLQNDGATGISGQIVTLIGGGADGVIGTGGDDTTATATTGTDGFYQFTGLTPGVQYQVMFNKPAGTVFTTQDANSNSQDADDSDADPNTGKSQIVTLSSGENNPTIDAGVYIPAALGDRVWEDKNGNGQQDNGENGIPGATVKLYTCVNNAPGVFVAQTTTDGNGNYSFANLAPGDYIVKFITPTGFSLTTANVGADATDSDAGMGGLTGCYNLESGETDNTVDAGLVQLASIGDRVWEDKNGNGQQDNGENGIPGATVKLYTCVNNAPDVFVAQTTTDGNGNYSFANLAPGDYIVEFITPNGFERTQANVGGDASDSDNVGGLSGCYTLSPGETENTVDAGFYRPAALGDRVWLDSNANGQQDAGENGVPNVTVELYKCVNNQPSGAVLATDITDANGIYNFTNLAPGDYIVKFITPTGFSLTTANVGADATDSDAGAGGLTGCYNLESGETDNTVDAGIYKAGIDIEKFVKGRYQQEGGGGEGLTPGFWKTHSEYGPAPLSGWPETGYDPDDSFNEIFGVNVSGNPTLLQALNANGGGQNALLRHATAALLNAANPYVDYAYTVDQIIAQTRAAILSANTTDIESLKNLFMVQNELGADLSTPASGGGFVETDFADADTPQEALIIPVGAEVIYKFEVKNTGSVELSNVKVVDNNATVDNPNDDFEPTPTLSNGFNVGDTDKDGKLDVEETWLYTSSTKAIAGTAIANTATVTGTVPDVTVTDSDKAHYSTSALSQSIGDRVWEDKDRDGIQDQDEPSIPGVTVKLEDANGNVLQTQKTDNDGNYLFEVASGTYKVAVEQPAGFLATAKDQGTDDAQDSDIDSNTLKTDLITIAPGEQNLSVDAGFYKVNPTPGIAINKDADQAFVAPNTPVTFTYYVSNTGGVALSNITVVDDNATPDFAGDDFNPTAKLGANGKNIGDLDDDNQLDPNEVWKYEAKVIPPVKMTVTIGSTVYDSGTLTYTTLANGDIRVTYLQSNNFNDNTYGTSSDAGWAAIGKVHKFSDLTNSDKAGFEIKNGNGNVLFKFYQDYITSSGTNIDGYTSYSGYQSLGYSGGDGSLVTGGSLNSQAANFLYDFDSTLETNLNRAGYTGFIVDSPLNDPNWNKVNGYSFTVKASAFDTAGFGGVKIFDQHNSPAKVGGSNSYIPDVVGGESTNTAVVTATLNSQTVVAVDDATVIIGESGGSGGGNTKFYVADMGVDKTFKYSDTGASIGNFAHQSGNTDSRDIAANYDGSNLWVLDKDKNVSVYSNTGGVLGTWKADGLDKEPEGITLDSNDLWMADRDRKIYWYDNAASNTSGTDKVDKTFTPSMSGNLKGIVTDGTYLWAVTEGGTDYVYRFNITRNSAGDPTGLTQDGLWKLPTANSKPTGITLDPNPTGASNSLWIVDESTDTVYEYVNGRSLTSGTASVAKSFKLAGTNLAPQGIADPLTGNGNAPASTDYILPSDSLDRYINSSDVWEECDLVSGTSVANLNSLTEPQDDVIGNVFCTQDILPSNANLF
jgi:hypothetical protein